MKLTALQSLVVQHWTDGHNVRVLAVPGAGKSAVMLEACKETDGVCLILAYNRELCLETKERIRRMGMESWVMCFTFHGLAQYCVDVCTDDIALLDIVDSLDAGRSPGRVLSNVSRVLIDEAQDFRPSFARLIRHLVPMHEHTQLMLVGDERQMLYDYSDDDPADLTYIETPDAHYPVSRREWSSVVLNESHRLTRPMAALVNKLFDARIETSRDGPPVEVYTRNMWKVAFDLTKILSGQRYEECCILVSRKQGNGPLRSTVNQLSKRGVKVYVHGDDGADARVREKKLGVSTWYAAKGTERRVCVVFGFASDSLEKLNPAYVGLTRSFERLIIIHDERFPSSALIRALRGLPSESLSVDAATASLMANGDVPEYTSEPRAERDVIGLDAWRASGSGRWIRDFLDVETVRAAVGGEDGQNDAMMLVGSVHAYDCSETYRVAVLMRVEIERTGRCRRMHDMLHTVRMSREGQDMVVRTSESHARFVAPNIPDAALMETSTRMRVRELVRVARPWSTNEWCFASCAACAWYGFQHSLNQLAPYDWMEPDEFEAMHARLLERIAQYESVDFDVRLVRHVGKFALHARCAMSTPEAAWLVINDSVVTHAHRARAAIVGALHPSSTCKVFSIGNGSEETIRVRDRDAFLTRLVS